MVSPPGYQQDLVQLHALQRKHKCEIEGDLLNTQLLAIIDLLHGGHSVMAQLFSLLLECSCICSLGKWMGENV